MIRTFVCFIRCYSRCNALKQITLTVHVNVYIQFNRTLTCSSNIHISQCSDLTSTIRRKKRISKTLPIIFCMICRAFQPIWIKTTKLSSQFFTCNYYMRTLTLTHSWLTEETYAARNEKKENNLQQSLDACVKAKPNLRHSLPLWRQTWWRYDKYVKCT